MSHTTAGAQPTEAATKQPSEAQAQAVAGTASPLLPWRRQHFPVDWDAEFGNAGPLVLEVGFGDGRYTVRRAVAEPEKRFVGLEVSSVSLQRALKRIRRTAISNVRVAKVGAEFGLRQLFGHGVLEAIVVNFPDPWPKEKHERHRLLKRSFFELAATRLQAGGEIRLATDHLAYLEFALQEAKASGLFTASFPEPPPDVFETKYALKWRDQGIPLNYAVFTYGGAPLVGEDHENRGHDDFGHLERPTDMPHSLLSGTLPANAPLTKIVISYGGGHVVLHEAAAVMPQLSPLPVDGERTRWLVRATIEEPDLKQQLLVLVQQRKPSEVIVRLESFGDPVITPAVRGAVHAVTEWLAQTTDLDVTQRNY